MNSYNIWSFFELLNLGNPPFIRMNDADMGVWTYTYNALGSLLTQTDARGQTVCMGGYTPLGQVLADGYPYSYPSRYSEMGSVRIC